jgi:integrase
MPRAHVSVGPRGHTLERHKRFAPGTSAQTIRDWKTTTRAELLAKLPAHVISGTLAADVEAYLVALPPHQRRFADYACGKWVEVFGGRETLSLTRQDLQRQLVAWRKTLAAGTVNKLRSKLAMVFRTRYPDHPNPVPLTDKYREPRGEAPTLTLADARAVIDGLVDSRAKRMLQVFCETGAPPARIARVRAEHLRLDDVPPMVYLESRRKGRGTVGRWFPLTEAGALAWADFAQHDDWGGTDPTCLWQVFTRGCERAGLPRTRPYVLRHIIASELLRRCGGNVYAVADLLDVTVQTAQHYARGGVPDAVAALISAMDAPSGQPSGQ